MFDHILFAAPHIDHHHILAPADPCAKPIYHHQIQIIQLDEAPAPPPRTTTCVSDASSSYASSFSSSSSSEQSEDSDQHSVVSSYCSSDEEHESAQCDDDSSSSASDTDSVSDSMTRKRILVWRETFSAALDVMFSPESPSSSAASTSSLKKRKLDADDDDDRMSHCSKRSRSSQGSAPKWSPVSLGLWACPACDVSFSTPQSFKLHGSEPSSNEACAAAVNYAFES